MQIVDARQRRRQGEQGRRRVSGTTARDMAQLGGLRELTACPAGPLGQAAGHHALRHR